MRHQSVCTHAPKGTHTVGVQNSQEMIDEYL